MTKQQQQTRMAVNRTQGAIEQHTIIDDSLIPSAEELQKLKDVDPSIVQWILDHADKEQQARISFNENKIKIAKSEHAIVKSSLWLAFAVLIAGMAMSSIFVWSGQEIAGTVFGGISMVVCVQSFLRFGRKGNP
jgi:uncharacterized membrane protein